MESTNKSHKWLIFFSTSLLLLLMNIDMTAVNLALAPIAQDLNLNITSVQWIISAYLLGGASFVLLGGILGDTYGHKKLFLTGSIIFTLASLWVGSASTEWELIASRLLQGLGAALAWPLAIVIVRQTFAKQEALAMGLIVSVMGASMSIGPPLGGLILNYLGWRWIFFINIPLGLLAILVGFIYLHKDKPRQDSTHVHWPSSLLLIAGLFSLIFSLNEIERLGLDSLIILSSFVGGIGCLIAFSYLQKFIKNPLIDLKLFANNALSCCFIVRFLWQFIWIGLFLALSLLFQNILGYSAIQTSLLFLVATLSFSIMSPIGGHLSKTINSRTLIMISFACYLVDFAGFGMVTPDAPLWFIIVLYLLYGVGSGFGFSTLLNTALALAPEEKRGMVSGTVYAMLFSGGTLGAVVTGGILGSIGPKTLLIKLQTLSVEFSQASMKWLMTASTGVRNIAALGQHISTPYSNTIKTLVINSFLHAFMVLMIVYICICLITIGFAIFIKPLPVQHTEK